MARAKKKTAEYDIETDGPPPIKAAPQDDFRRMMAECLTQLKQYHRVNKPGAAPKPAMSCADFMMNLYYCFSDVAPGYDFSKIGAWLIDQMADKIEELSIDNRVEMSYNGVDKMKKIKAIAALNEAAAQFNNQQWAVAHEVPPPAAPANPNIVQGAPQNNWVIQQQVVEEVGQDEAFFAELDRIDAEQAEHAEQPRI